MLLDIEIFVNAVIIDARYFYGYGFVLRRNMGCLYASVFSIYSCIQKCWKVGKNNYISLRVASQFDVKIR
jgi:hypothetical protein